MNASDGDIPDDDSLAKEFIVEQSRLREAYSAALTGEGIRGVLVVGCAFVERELARAVAARLAVVPKGVRNAKAFRINEDDLAGLPPRRLIPLAYAVGVISSGMASVLSELIAVRNEAAHGTVRVDADWLRDQIRRHPHAIVSPANHPLDQVTDEFLVGVLRVQIAATTAVLAVAARHPVPILPGEGNCLLDNQHETPDGTNE